MNTRQRLLAAGFVAVAGAAFWVKSTHRNPVPRGTDAAGPVSLTVHDSHPLSRQMTDHLLMLLRAESDPAKREAAAQQAAQHIPRALLPAVLADLRNEYDRNLATEASRAILLRWAWEEPSDAAAWVTQSNDLELRRDALAAVGAGWARQNPEALMSWATTLSPSDRDWVLLHGASYLARTDLNTFAVWTKALPSSRETEQLTAQAAREWAGRDPKAVAKAIGEFSGPEYSAWRIQMAAGLANQLSLAEKCETAFAILDTMAPSAEKQQVLKGTVIGWSRRDPTVVATWLDTVSDQPLRTEMSTLLAGLWFERDSPAAEKWASSLPAGALSDAVAERAAQYFAPRNHTVAEQWANRIQSQEMRTRTSAYINAAQPLVALP